MLMPPRQCRHLWLSETVNFDFPLFVLRWHLPYPPFRTEYAYVILYIFTSISAIKIRTTSFNTRESQIENSQ